MTILKCGVAAILTLTSVYSVAMGAADHWMLWAEGAPPNWAGIKSWVSNQTTLPCDKLVIRLLDPDAANGSGDDFKLSGGITVEVLAFIKEIRGAGFTGEISMLPYFTGDWVWTPDGVTINNEWEKPFYWCIQANQILMAAGVSQGVFEVNFENENSAGILQVDDAALLAVQTFQHTLWPEFSQSGGFIGLAATKGYTSALDMLRWTTTPLDGSGFSEPPLSSGVLEIYNMSKCCPGGSNCTTTFVDAYSTVPQTPNPSPASPTTIYTRAAAASDPVTDILGTATADCPAHSDFGFLFGNKTPPCINPTVPPNCMTGADMSRVWCMFSTESLALGTIDAFGTWDAAPGAGASIATFKSFCEAFDEAFYTQYWNNGTPIGAAKPPRYGIFQLERMPASWKPSTSGPDPCDGDLNGDEQVDIVDVLQVIENWATPGGDANGDGDTDIADLLLVLEAYGNC